MGGEGSAGDFDEQPFDRAAAGREARQFFDKLWSASDPWALDDSELDQRRYRRQAELLADRRYSRALEIGCAGGSFTKALAPLCDELVALDIAEAAIDRARAAADRAGVEFRLANVWISTSSGRGPGTWS